MCVNVCVGGGGGEFEYIIETSYFFVCVFTC